MPGAAGVSQVSLDGVSVQIGGYAKFFPGSDEVGSLIGPEQFDRSLDREKTSQCINHA